MATGYGPRSHRLLFDGKEETFEIWLEKFTGHLRLRSLEKFLTPRSDASEISVADYESKNNDIYAELLQCLDDKSVALIMRDAKNKGREALEILQEHYAGHSKPKIVGLYVNLANLEMKRNESMTDYILRAEKMSSLLKAAGETVSDGLLIAMVTKGLSPEYETFAVLTSQRSEEPSFTAFKVALRNFQETRHMHNQYKTDEASTDAVLKLQTQPKKNQDDKPKRWCSHCKMSSHNNDVCWKLHGKPKTKKSRWCDNCKSSTHDTSYCRKKQTETVKQVTTEELSNSHFTFTLHVRDSSQNNLSYFDSFLVDSGASAHILYDPKLFKSMKPVDAHCIELADGTRCTNVLKGKGEAEIQIHDTNGNTQKLTLNNALFIPSYNQNIFSVQAAADKGAKFTFSAESSHMSAPNGTKFKILKDGKLYYLNKAKHEPMNKEKRSIQEWHRTLGHCNMKDITKLPDVVDGMKITNSKENAGKEPSCEICIKGKMKQTFTRQPDDKAASPLQLVHCDLAGPIDPISTDGFRYSLMFIDDYSGCCSVFFLKNKSETLKATERYLADIAPIGTPKTIRSDNGTEFQNKNFADLMLKHKIKHQFSAPYSPHQNGTIERAWRTVFETARTMLIESEVGKTMWPFAVNAAVFTRNRCFNSRTGKTPFESLTGIRPNLSKLHIFGQKCYGYIQNPKKLDERAEEGTFLGYDPKSPAYLMMIPGTQRIKRVRCVRFLDSKQTETTCHDDSDTELDSDLPFEPYVTTDKTNAEHNPQARGAESQLTEQTRRYPQREHSKPKHLDDYVAKTDAYTVEYCYKSVMGIPQTYREAMNSPEAQNWSMAMDDEIQSLSDNDTFELTELPVNEQLIGGRWVYATKQTPDGKCKYKARYVAKGYSQIEGVNYDQVFSPTPKLVSLRILIQLSVEYDMTIHQMDVKSAYLHAPIDCDIYVKQPEGYQQGDNLVWKLKKSLYGLKQSGRNWNATIHNHFMSHDFEQSPVDPCIYTRHSEKGVIIVLIWVDDIIIAASSLHELESVKKQLKNSFKMKDLGELSHFLGMQFSFNKDSITMNQSQYISKILSRFDMQDCKPRSTPCEMKLDFSGDPIPNTQYREMIGSLIYAMLCTRPDLSLVVSKLSQFLDKPSKECLVYVKQVFQYLKASIDYNLTFRKTDNGLNIVGFVDSDWGTDLHRKSTTGYCFTLNHPHGPSISWQSRKQQTVALSTCEAEYMALSDASAEAIFLTALLSNLNCKLHKAAKIYCDNQSAISLAQNAVCRQRSKHIDIRYHFVRQHILQGNIVLQYIPTHQNLADIFTKPVSNQKLKSFLPHLFHA